MKVIPFDYYVHNKNAAGYVRVYDIQDNEGRWFAWCYRTEDMAEQTMFRIPSNPAALDVTKYWIADNKHCKWCPFLEYPSLDGYVRIYQ
jgi:hypothetical protein